jgi:hypothetical protein
MDEVIALSVAVHALQHLYRAFTGRELSESDAKRLLLDQDRVKAE